MRGSARWAGVTWTVLSVLLLTAASDDTSTCVAAKIPPGSFHPGSIAVPHADSLQVSSSPTVEQAAPLHVAVVIIPERGHLTSVRDLVLELATRGHRITFMSLEACLRDDASGCAETVSGWTAQNLAHPAIHVHLSSPAEGLVRTSELLAELNHACHDHEAGDSDLARSLRVADVMMAEGFRMYQRMLPALLERAEADPPSLVLTDSSTFAGLDLAAFLRLPLVVNSPTPILSDATVPHGLLVPTYSASSRRLGSLRTLRGRVENAVEHMGVLFGFAFMHQDGVAVRQKLGMHCAADARWPLRWLLNTLPHPWTTCTWPHHPERAVLGWDFPGHAHLESNHAVAHAWVLQGAVLGSLESPRKMEPRYFQVGPMFEPLPSGATLAEKDPFGVMEWIANCETPVVYISFGTVVDLRAAQTTRILDSLLQLPGVCVLWSLREQAWGSLPADPAEFSRAKGGAALKIVPFAPQRHVLAHPNVWAFVTHCGQNSLNEAFMQSKPVIGLPVFADQLVLCSRVEDTGAGLCLPPLTSPWLAAVLRDAVLAVLGSHHAAFTAGAHRHFRLMRTAGGTRRAADLVQLAAEVPQVWGG